MVAQIGNQNPYAVPPVYFDNLPMQVLLRIAMEEKAGTDPVLNISKENTYQAPQGYFEGLAGNILNRIKAQEAGNAKEELELLSPLLGQIGKKTPFTSPEGYFTDFSENMMAGVKAIEFVNEELENLSPLMIELKSKQVYEVPQGYFDTTAAIILNKIKQQPPAKVISIGFGKKIMRYAAAAVITGIVVLSGYFYAGKRTVSAIDDIHTAAAKIPDQEIENFLNNSSSALADIGMDAADTVAAKDVAAVDSNANDTKDLLANISDEELQQYIDQRSETPVTN